MIFFYFETFLLRKLEAHKSCKQDVCSSWKSGLRLRKEDFRFSYEITRMHIIIKFMVCTQLVLVQQTLYNLLILYAQYL